MTIVALGDSTTAGTPGFSSPLESPPRAAGNPESQFAYWMMKARPEWRVLNRGINGERADAIRARFAHDVEVAKPRVVIILAGVNDAYQGRRAQATQADLAWMYQRAKALGIVPVAATILPFSRASEAQSLRIEAHSRWSSPRSRDLSRGRRCVGRDDRRPRGSLTLVILAQVFQRAILPRARQRELSRVLRHAKAHVWLEKL